MKTKIILSAFVLTLFSVGMGTSALASANKYDNYQARVEGTKGISAGVKETKHGNKYCRVKMERDGLGGTIFPSHSEAREDSPKSYRYQN